MNKIDGRFIDYSPWIDKFLVKTPPESPEAGYQCIINGSELSGIFVGHEKEVASWNGTEWKFRKPALNEFFRLKDTKDLATGYTWDGNAYQIIKEAYWLYKPMYFDCFAKTGTELPATAEIGDVFVNISSSLKHTATASNKWDNGTYILTQQNNFTAFVVSTNEHKVLMLNMVGTNPFLSFPICNGGIVYNRTEKCIYVRVGDNYVKAAPSPDELEAINSNVSSATGAVKSVEAVVLGIIAMNDFSVSNQILLKGDRVIDAAGKLVTFIQTGVWDDTNTTNKFISKGEYVASLDTGKIYVKTNNWYEEVESLSDGYTFFSKADGFTYAYDATAGTFIKVGASESVTETHVLTAAEVTAKSFNLTNNVKTGEETNILCFVQGVAQAAGVAFAVSGRTFGWTDKTLDGNLSAGDVFIVHYVKA